MYRTVLNLKSVASKLSLSVYRRFIFQVKCEWLIATLISQSSTKYPFLKGGTKKYSIAILISKQPRGAAHVLVSCNMLILLWRHLKSLSVSFFLLQGYYMQKFTLKETTFQNFILIFKIDWSDRPVYARWAYQRSYITKTLLKQSFAFNPITAHSRLLSDAY